MPRQIPRSGEPAKPISTLLSRNPVQKYRTIIEPGREGIPGKAEQKSIPLSLFDLETDIGETTNVAAENPNVVQRLKTLADKMRAELGDGKQNPGLERRPLGKAN